MIIGLSGYARSGKDTAADYLESKYNFARVSFAAPMKEAMYALNPIVSSDSIGSFRYKDLVDVYGLDKAKDSYPEIRRLLQIFGTEVGRSMFGENFWVDLALKNIKNENIVVTDVRFRNEANAIKDMGGQIWRVNRASVKPVTGHVSEVDLDDYSFDHIIENDFSINEMHSRIEKYMNDTN